MQTSYCLTELTARDELEIFKVLNERIDYDFDLLNQKIRSIRQNLSENQYLTPSFLEVLKGTDYQLIGLGEGTDNTLEVFKCNCGTCETYDGIYTFRPCGDRKVLDHFEQHLLEPFLESVTHGLSEVSLNLVCSRILSTGCLNGMGDIYQAARYMSMLMVGIYVKPEFQLKLPVCGCGNCDKLFDIKWSFNGIESHVDDIEGFVIASVTYEKCGQVFSCDYPWMPNWFSNVVASNSCISSRNLLPQSLEVLKKFKEHFPLTDDDLVMLAINPVKRVFNAKYGARKMMVAVKCLQLLHNEFREIPKVRWHVYNDERVNKKAREIVDDILTGVPVEDETDTEMDIISLERLLKEETETSEVLSIPTFSKQSEPMSFDMISLADDLAGQYNTMIECLGSCNSGLEDYLKGKIKNAARIPGMLKRGLHDVEGSKASVEKHITMIKDSSGNFIDKDKVMGYIDKTPFTATHSSYVKPEITTCEPKKSCKVVIEKLKVTKGKLKEAYLESSSDVKDYKLLRSRETKKVKAYVQDIMEEINTKPKLHSLKSGDVASSTEIQQMPKDVEPHTVNVRKFSVLVKKMIKEKIEDFLTAQFNVYYDEKKDYYLPRYRSEAMRKELCWSQFTIINDLHEYKESLIADSASLYREAIQRYINGSNTLIKGDTDKLVYNLFKRVLRGIKSARTRMRLLTLTKHNAIRLTVNTVLRIDEYREVRECLKIKSSDWARFTKSLHCNNS